MTSQPLDRNALRREVRQRRRDLTPYQHDRLSLQLVRQITRSTLFQRARTIGLYLPNDGEVDLRGVAERAWSMGKQCYLPVLSPLYHNRLWFAPFTTETPLSLNRFNIPEPDHNWRAMRPVWSIDLLLMPLVAFDEQGNRLGMGGGFYDRTLAYLQRRHHWRKPQLLGTAFELQRFNQLPHQPWDVPLDVVVTERQFYRHNP